ncbi:MAG: RNA methyltransferase [Bacillota bacterium]|nr:RNA methyltransferase [Bacillota bacterium]
MEKIITSTSNPYVKHLKKLQTSKKYREEKGIFVLEGERPVKDALSYGVKPEALLISENRREDFGEAVVYRLQDRVLEYISDTKTPQGIMAEIKMPVWDAKKISPESAPFLIFSDGISDPGNLGTIIRTIDAGGGGGIVLGQGTVDIYNPKTVRGTMSSLFNVPLYRSADNAQTINILKNKGYYIVGTRMENASLYTETDFKRPTVLVMGNEANGISDAVMKLYDEFVKIPIAGKIESLNVAVSAAVIIYEAVRQRNIREINT